MNIRLIDLFCHHFMHLCGKGRAVKSSKENLFVSSCLSSWIHDLSMVGMHKLWLQILKMYICYTGLVWHFFPNNTMSWIAGKICRFVWVCTVYERERAISSPNTITRAFTVAPEAIPTRLQGGRQVNEKLLILSLYPRRWGEVTLILPNFVFLFFWWPGHSVATPGPLGRGEQREDLCERWCRQRRLARE